MILFIIIISGIVYNLALFQKIRKINHLIEIEPNYFIIEPDYLNVNYTNVSSNNCNPILQIDKQYYANFNGDIYPKILRLSFNKSLNFECLNKNFKPNIILFWNPFGNDIYYLNKDGLAANECPVSNCILTNNKKLINKADLVVIHMPNYIEPLPEKRPKNQLVVFSIYESPAHYSISPKHRKYFNLTSTYSPYSDFPSGQTNMLWQKNPNYNPNKNYLDGKTEMAFAIISNCNDKSNRLEYIKEMSKYINVQVFGKCGQKCLHKECKKILSKKYMFYLAFENSIC